MPDRRHTVPAIVKPRFEEIVGLIETVCCSHLTEEYATVARELAAGQAYLTLERNGLGDDSAFTARRFERTAPRRTRTS